MATITCNLKDTAHGGKDLATASGGSSSRTLDISTTAYYVKVEFYGYGGISGKSHTYTLGFDKDAYNSSTGTTFEATKEFTKTLNDDNSDAYQYLGAVEYTNNSGFSNFRIGVKSHSSSSGGQLFISRCVVTYTNKFTLTISKGNYISSVSGGGSYTPGTKVSISATLSSATGYNYSFSKWSSNNGGTFGSSTSASTTFTMPSNNVTITATGTRAAKTLTITYYRNRDSSDTTTSTETFTYSGNDSAGNFGNNTTASWTKTDYEQSKWTSVRDGTGTSWTINNKVTDSRINSSSPSLKVYLQWAVKQKPGCVAIFTSETDRQSYRPYIFNGTSWVKYSAYYYDGGWKKTNIKATSVDN